MVNFSFPSDSLLLTNKHFQRLQQQQQQRQHAELTSKGAQQPKQAPEDEVLVGAPPAFGGPWVLCQDQQGFPFWLSDTTGQWTYAGASNIVQPPPPPMMYVPRVPQHHTTWIVSPTAAAPTQPMVLVSVAAPPASPTSDSPKKEGVATKAESKMFWPKPTWEECWDEEGKIAWIHGETGKLVHNDPYE